MAPLVRRTWSPCGQTPILHQRTGMQEKVSAIAALTVSPQRKHVGLYFSMGIEINVNRYWVLAFIKALACHFRNPLIVVWDRLPAHRAREVADYFAKHPRLRIELLPPYAPDLNPVELVWSYLKMNPLANFAPVDAEQLCRRAHRHLANIRGSQELLRSFILATPLSSCLQ